MPAQPKPRAPTPPTHVEVAGTQEMFEDVGRELAAKLGWTGEEDWEQFEITVADARGYLVKCLHEQYQAAARGEEQPDYKAACEHLAVDTAEEQAAIDKAFKQAFEAGKGATVTLHERVVADLGQVKAMMDERSAKRIAGKAAG